MNSKKLKSQSKLFLDLLIPEDRKNKMPSFSQTHFLMVGPSTNPVPLNHYY